MAKAIDLVDYKGAQRTAGYFLTRKVKEQNYKD